MDKRSLISNFSVAVLAQGVTMASSVITALLFPKVMGVEQYGYWQLLMFYASYVGFFHFGLCDGVYLIEGGHLRSAIDKRKVNSQFWFGLSYQIIIALIILAVAIAQNLSDARSFVLAVAALLLLLNNAFTFLVYTLQSMNEPKKYSCASIINAVTFLIPSLGLLLVGVTAFEAYVACFIFGRIISLAYSIYVTRDILTSGLLGFKETARLSLHSIRVGVKLMLSNICGMLILGVAQFFIDLHWSIEVFSIVSYAIAMSNFFLTFISQASMVLFPALRLAKTSEVIDFFFAARDALNLFLPCVFLLYIPAKLILDIWLPNYAESLELFAILLPLCVFNGKMDLLGTTYLKVLRNETALLIINAISFGLSAAIVIVATYLFDSFTIALLGALIVIVARSFATELYVKRRLGDPRSAQRGDGLSVAVIVITVVFVGSAMAMSALVSWLIIAIAYGAYLALFRRQLKTVGAILRSINATKADHD